VHADVGKTTLSLLRSPQPLPVETLLGPLLNEIAALAQSSVLVLDDYHLIDAQPIHQAIGFLLDHLPPSYTWSSPAAPIRLCRSVASVHVVNWPSYEPRTCVSPSTRLSRSSTT
jgi:ATP/maltotriose-dependent transcriptional regulator MalT